MDNSIISSVTSLRNNCALLFIKAGRKTVDLAFKSDKDAKGLSVVEVSNCGICSVVEDFSHSNAASRAEGVEGGEKGICEAVGSFRSKSRNSRHSVMVNCMRELIPTLVGAFL